MHPCLYYSSSTYVCTSISAGEFMAVNLALELNCSAELLPHYTIVHARNSQVWRYFK